MTDSAAPTPDDSRIAQVDDAAVERVAREVCVGEYSSFHVTMNEFKTNYQTAKEAIIETAGMMTMISPRQKKGRSASTQTRSGPSSGTRTRQLASMSSMRPRWAPPWQRCARTGRAEGSDAGRARYSR